MKHTGKMLPFAAAALILAFAMLFGPALVQQLAYASARGTNQADREELVKLSQREQLSRLFRAVAATVKPAVVVVRVETEVEMPRMPRFDMEDFFRRFSGEDFSDRSQVPRREGQRQPREGQRQPRERRYFVRRGLGSGVIVDAEKGYVLTNSHVVFGADKIKLITHDGQQFATEWVRTDAATDLAVVKIKDPKGLIGVALGDSGGMEVGDWVLAIGAPEGLPQTVTAGIISAKGRATGRRVYEDLLQTDAAINKGNSGGPLVNMRGEVIGINTAIISRTGVNEGIGLAIPSNMAGNVMRQLIDKGKVVRGYLGVLPQDVDEDLAEDLKLPNVKGALVARVEKGAPADKAGLAEEDFIVALDGKPIEDATDLRHRIADLRPGAEVELTIYRSARKKTVTVKLATRPAYLAEGVQERKGRSRPKRYGLEVETLTERLAERYGFDKDTKGVLIADVEPDSDAAEEGLRPGMVIDKVGGKKVTTAEEFARAAADKENIRVRVLIAGPVRGQRIVMLSPK